MTKKLFKILTPKEAKHAHGTSRAHTYWKFKWDTHTQTEKERGWQIKLEDSAMVFFSLFIIPTVGMSVCWVLRWIRMIACKLNPHYIHLLARFNVVIVFLSALVFEYRILCCLYLVLVLLHSVSHARSPACLLACSTSRKEVFIEKSTPAHIYFSLYTIEIYTYNTNRFKLMKFWALCSHTHIHSRSSECVQSDGSFSR